MPDMTLLGFIEHLAEFDHRLHRETHRGLERAARLVEAEAKREIGHYQDGAGPFAGWAELAGYTQDERVKLGFTENDPGLRTGEMGASIGHAVGDKEAVVGSNDAKLEWFELGTPHQPPRSVLGIAAVHKETDVAKVLGAAVVLALVGQKVSAGRLPIN